MKLKRRWRMNGPDYETGCMRTDKNSVPLGAGATVSWRHDNTWSCQTWQRGLYLADALVFDNLTAAKAYCEARLASGR